MALNRIALAAGARAAMPVLLGIVPFGVITGVAMVASGIPPFAAMAMSVIVFAGASMMATAQLLSQGTPIALIVLATLFINLRFMMYSASLRLHLARLPLRWRLVIATAGLPLRLNIMMAAIAGIGVGLLIDRKKLT